jgi:hypothetical protein
MQNSQSVSVPLREFLPGFSWEICFSESREKMSPETGKTGVRWKMTLFFLWQTKMKYLDYQNH